MGISWGRRRALLVALLLLVQVAAVIVAPAALAAQPVVTGCTPTSGPVGTSVTITGSDLSGVDRVEFDGTDATFTINQAGTSITTTVPTGATSGALTVTDLGGNGGTASCSSSFTVTATQTPTVTSFTPTSGPVGTSVTITGTNFTGATAVRFNGVTSTFTVNSATQVTATVPAGATDGSITVQNSAGTGTSSTSFDVTAVPAPAITSFTPTSGPPGTSVVITGTNFTGATAVRFAGTTSTFTVNSSTQITATVPSGASTGAITVTTPTGTATSSSSFTVTAGGPAITSFTPSSGCVGSSVTINGTNLSGATAVTIDGVAATITNNTSTRVIATVPVGATTGKIVVTTANGTATSSTDYTVNHCAPTIASFSPTSGVVGSTVVISGDDFTGTVTVKFGTVNAAFTVNSDSQITTTVPTGASTGKITVTNDIGSTSSGSNFTLIQAPTISSFSPSNGPAGTEVTINGTNFTGTTAVAFNGVAATFTLNSATRITAVVPTGASTGRITVTNPAGTATSSTDFTVSPPPSVTSFSPGFGPEGTEVTISGFFFTGATSVRFGSVAAEFTLVSSTEIHAVVPVGADDGSITVITPSGAGSSEDDFVVQDIHARTVSLTLSEHILVLGKVSSLTNADTCVVNVAVKIQRYRDGRWRTLKVLTTDGDGDFTTRLSDRTGRYRARAPRLATSQDLCKRSTSTARRHSH
jgi:large repetitive protein